MKKLACRYAIVQFMPYPETGEFANVGIVLVCPQTGYFSFRLQEPRRYGRLTAFFEEMDAKLFTRSITHLEAELERLAKGLQESGIAPSPQLIRDLFEHLIHPREAIIRFGNARAVLVGSPQAALAELFEYYVERSFATKEYQEKTLEKRVASFIQKLRLPMPFRPERVGDNDFSVAFPLVQPSADGMPKKLIKPFFLAQDEPQKIYDHGGGWVVKIHRLRSLGHLPPDVLFAVKAPEQSQERHYRAFQAVCNDLKAEGVVVMPESAEQDIIEFAVA